MMGYNFSLAIVIGLIALAGLDAETGMVMLLYLDNSYEPFRTRRPDDQSPGLVGSGSRRSRETYPSQDDDRVSRIHRPCSAAMGTWQRR